MDTILKYIDRFTQQLINVLKYPIEHGERIYWLYLLSSLAFALAVYLVSPEFKQNRQEGTGFLKGLFRFLFPAKIWSHKSAWVDVRYFVPHQLVRLWIYTDLLFGVQLLTDGLLTSGLGSLTGRTSIYTASANSPALLIGFTLIYFLLLDFASFYLHYLQHKIPTLWEFHKIHHSAQVMHPLTNYREHPVDNVAYAVATGIAGGLVMSLFRFLFSVEPTGLIVTILSVPALKFAFNLFGYNLRHSHIWVRWPGIFAYLFGCPAHHQIHHSCKPHHINKNFAFMFPIWDVLFGTFHLPKEEEELEIGLGDGTDEEYCSFATLYFLPFRKLLKQYAQKLQDSQLQSEEDRPQDLSQIE